MDKNPFPIFINRVKHEVTNPLQTGKALKELGGIPLTDTLFLERPHEDLVVTNEMEVELKPGAHLHSSPPANYGNTSLDAAALAMAQAATVLPQPDGWTFVVFNDYDIPTAYSQHRVKLLVKLPPQFPDAKPDMFWISPPVQVHGSAPRGTSIEVVLGESWMRFSWHLADGAWRPGISELRDFLRCIKARFERRD